MANQWLRLYSEFANDPKVQMLPEVCQRRYIMLLCIRCSNGDVTLQDSEVTFLLRISNEEWQVTKQNLLQKNLINECNLPTAWDKRQFASDSSAERVRKHREGKKQPCNVTVTPQNRTEQNRTDEAQRATKSVARVNESFEKFWSAYPKRKNRGQAEKVWEKIKPDAGLVAAILAAVEVAKAGDDWRKDAGQFVPYPATWLNAKGWLDDRGTPQSAAIPGGINPARAHLFAGLDLGGKAA